MSAAQVLSALSLAATGKTATGSGSALGHGWRDHLEKAQAAGWFCRSDALQPGATAEHARPTGASRPRSEPRISAARAVPASPAASPARQSNGLPARALPNEASPGHVASSREPVEARAREGEGLCGCLPACTAARESEAPSGTWREALVRWSPPPRPAPDSAMSLHVHQDERGAQVWLGIPGQPAQVAPLAGAVLVALRRELALAGVPLQRVVCNGALLYANPGSEDV